MIDKINPPHYQQGKIEVIEFILDQKLNYLEETVLNIFVVINLRMD